MKEKRRILILSVISLSVFLIVLMFVIFGKVSLDYFVSNLAQKMWNPTTNGFFIFMGDYSRRIIVFIAITVAVFLYSQKRRMQSLVLVLTLVAGFILEHILELIIQRGRPAIQMIQESGYSFPSGHSISSIILFSFIIYFYKDEIKNKAGRAIFIFINIFLILLAGFSRIYLNVHWFSDVIGGYALGFFLFNIGVLFLKDKS
ncbi:MAG: phosphatase PAP2 family protein [Nanoarchaeota archaeon]|nr:phosphatase PAP2 family protein [Nanoarchaeota archaeon]